MRPAARTTTTSSSFRERVCRCAKKRYTLYLSRPLARKFEPGGAAAPRLPSRRWSRRRCARASSRSSTPGVEEGLAAPARRAAQDCRAHRARLSRRHRDAGAVRALLPDHHAAAAATASRSRRGCSARKRFEVFVAEVGRRVAERSAASCPRCCETIADNQPGPVRHRRRRAAAESQPGPSQRRRRPAEAQRPGGRTTGGRRHD